MQSIASAQLYLLGVATVLIVTRARENAPAKLQRVVVYELQKSGSMGSAMAFIDDILIYSNQNSKNSISRTKPELNRYTAASANWERDVNSVSTVPGEQYQK